MKRLAIKNRKVWAISVIFFGVFFFANTAQASILSNFSSGLRDLMVVLNNKFVGQIKGDFCTQYNTSVSGGIWKENELKLKIGRNLCGEYILEKPSGIVVFPPSSESSVSKFIPVKTTVSLKTEVKTATSSQNNTPVALINNNNIDGATLNSGEIIYWTNIERGKENIGLTSLTENKILKNIAGQRVADMFAQGYFEHVSPTGETVSKIAVRSGYKYITVGENLAIGSFPTSRDLVIAWMNSPGHRANIVNKNYTEIGVSASQGLYDGQKVWIAVQVFGRPLSYCEEPDTDKKSEIDKNNDQLSIFSAYLNKTESELKAFTKEELESYNEIVVKYNTLITTIKKLSAEYNKQVEVFNDCIKIQ